MNSTQNLLKELNELDDNEFKNVKAIVCGGRHFDNYDYLEITLDSIFEELDLDYENIEIVSGNCNGTDKLGEQYAKEHCIKTKVFPAEWKKYGRAAGPIRNEKMIEYISNSDLPVVIAFVSENSKGTLDTIKRANKRNLKTFIFEYSSKNK